MTTLAAADHITLRGAQVIGQQVGLDMANLTIHSLQDSERYRGKQWNLSGQYHTPC